MEVDLDDRCARHGGDMSTFAGALAALEPLAADGICVVDGGTVRVAETHRPFARLVASAFDAYLKPNKKRHARAV